MKETNAHYRRLRVPLVLLVTALLAAGGAWFWRAKLLAAVGGLLVTDNPSEGTHEYALILNGDRTGQRASAALARYRAGTVRHLLIIEAEADAFSDAGLTDGLAGLHRRWLLAQGVPAEAVTVIDGCVATSTLDEAVCLREWLARSSPSTTELALITSWYHTARVKWLFDPVLAGAHVKAVVYPAVSSRSRPDDWWRSETAFIAVFNEYLKWIYWLAIINDKPDPPVSR